VHHICASLRTRCALTTHSLRTRCALATLSLRSHCALIAHSLPPRCPPALCLQVGDLNYRVAEGVSLEECFRRIEMGPPGIEWLKAFDQVRDAPTAL
jgi:hypothetical protein